MRFMVIETFKEQSVRKIYARLDERGRMMLDGLRYVDSWIQADFRRCFQLMECDDAELFQQWIAHWDDLMEFEAIPVTASAQARKSAGPGA
ncbi:MAG: DUF3303 family protein [Myxococcota bacterium]